MVLMKTNVLFPTDFEEAYNRLHAGTKPRYSGGASTGLYIPINEDKYRKEVQDEERKVAIKRSIAYPRSRLYPQVIARGGDIQSEEARKLIPKLLEKRAEDYKKLAGIEVHTKEGGPSVSPSRALSVELESLLSVILDTISAGIFSTDTIEAGQQVLQSLIKSGNLLSARQLEYLYGDVKAVIGNLVEPTTGQLRADVDETQKRNYAILLTLMDTINRTFRAILSRVNLPAKSRQAFQRSVLRNAKTYFKKNARLGIEARERVDLDARNLPEIGEFIPQNPVQIGAKRIKGYKTRRIAGKIVRIPMYE